jgi:hypothetical protein
MDVQERYAVFHAHDLRAMLNPQAQEARWSTDQPRHFTHVADVVASLGQVFRLTNHIDRPWTRNPEVVWHDTAHPLRSTSVGDVILSHRSGQAWLVMPIGLRPLWSHEREEASWPSFPFGLARLVDYTELWRRYTEEIPLLAAQVALPMALPCRHPALAQVEGRYPIEDRLPPWWESCVQTLTRHCPCLAPLLRATSREEFRRGTLDQQRWEAWQETSCRERGEAQRPVPCWHAAGPSLSRLIAAVLPAGERGRWLDRFVGRGAKDTPQELDLVITAHPAWWLNMANGRNWFSCMGTGPDRDLRLPGNWYDTGVALAALVVRGGDCWAPGALIARTTLHVVTEDLPVVSEQDGSQSASNRPVQRVVLGRVYHNDHTAACTLLTCLIDLFEAHRLPWGCIAGTTTAELFLDGSLGAFDITPKPRRVTGVPYWLPAEIERPVLDGQGSYLEHDEQASQSSSKGAWTFPSFEIDACQRRTPPRTTLPHDDE